MRDWGKAESLIRYVLAVSTLGAGLTLAYCLANAEAPFLGGLVASGSAAASALLGAGSSVAAWRWIKLVFAALIAMVSVAAFVAVGIFLSVSSPWP
jgi:hypothetical protein